MAFFGGFNLGGASSSAAPPAAAAAAASPPEITDMQMQQAKTLLAPYLQAGASPESESSESLLRFCLGELRNSSGEGVEAYNDVLFEIYPGVLQLEAPEMEALIGSIRAVLLGSALPQPAVAAAVPAFSFGMSTAAPAANPFGAPAAPAFGQGPPTSFSFGGGGGSPLAVPPPLQYSSSGPHTPVATWGAAPTAFGTGAFSPTSPSHPAYPPSSSFGTFQPAFGVPAPPSPFGAFGALPQPHHTGVALGGKGGSFGGSKGGGASPFPFYPPSPAAAPLPGIFGGGTTHPYKIVCPYFLKGACKYGSKCSNIHDDGKANGKASNGKAGGGTSSKAGDSAAGEADYSSANWTEYIGLESMMLPMSDELLAYYNSTAYLENEGGAVVAVAAAAAAAPGEPVSSTAGGREAAPATKEAATKASSEAPDASSAAATTVPEPPAPTPTPSLGPALGPDLPPAPIHPPRGVMRALSTGREEELDSMSAVYREELEKIQAEFDDDGILKPMQGLRAMHHFGSKVPTEAPAANANTKKTLREITRELVKSLTVEARGSMFIRYDADEPQFIRAVLTGQDNTPYASGCFVFDIYLPPEYPSEPPQCIHVTKDANVKSLHASHSPGGFSPNLHRDSGKVCLSLLGTWNGPGWEAGKSNLYQLLSSIQLMILGATHPYYMEPNYGGWEGTAPASPAVDPVNGVQALEFEENVRVHTAWLAILNPLLAPPVGFEKAVLAHFLSKRKLIVAVLDSWVRKTKTPAFKAQLQQKMDLVLDAYEQHLSLQDLQTDFFEAVSSVRYIRKKQMALACHLDFIGEEPRLERLLVEGEMLLRFQKAILARTRRRYIARSHPPPKAEAEALAGGGGATGTGTGAGAGTGVGGGAAPLTKRIRAVCPGFNLRIRSSPTALSLDNVIGVVSTGSVLEVLAEPQDGFWALAKSTGYLMILAPGVTWEDVGN